MTGTENLAGPFCHGSAAVAVADFQIRGGQQRLSGLQGGARSNNASLQRQAMLHHQKERHQSLAATAAEVQGKASVFGSNGSRSAGNGSVVSERTSESSNGRGPTAWSRKAGATSCASGTSWSAIGSHCSAASKGSVSATNGSVKAKARAVS